MKITCRVEVEAVTDVRCDVCGCSTRLEIGNLKYGMLQARWGFDVLYDGKRYEVRLCEACFFVTIAYLKQAQGRKICLRICHNRPMKASGWSPRMTFSVMAHDKRALKQVLTAAGVQPDIISPQ
ncbi:hypothetical protein [Pseudomonas fragi]|uniref:hypothetical protein n=1 Tax=Pseudomonas fragi TaxID=296 RepID=UPI002FDED0EF